MQATGGGPSGNWKDAVTTAAIWWTKCRMGWHESQQPAMQQNILMNGGTRSLRSSSPRSMEQAEGYQTITTALALALHGVLLFTEPTPGVRMTPQRAAPR